MIRDLLGDPDQTRPNPVYRSAAPARLWSLARVVEAEGGPAFTSRRASGKRRSAVSAAAADRKRAGLLAGIRGVSVTVPRMDRDKVIRQACAHYNALAGERGRYDAAAGPDADPAFLERITVNYLRHELTGYEQELADLYGLTGRPEASRLIKERVLDAIAAAYPWLAGECQRQKPGQPAWQGCLSARPATLPSSDTRRYR